MCGLKCEAGSVITRRIFLDCDGVLADFDTEAERLFGLPPRIAEEKNGTSQFWANIHRHGSFYRDLPLMPDAMELVNAVRHLGPTILTGLPRGGWAEPHKREWGQKHFPDLPMICCMSVDKKNYMKPGDILIDDYLKYSQLWIDAGGIFIHHTSAKSSIQALVELGVLEREIKCP